MKTKKCGMLDLGIKDVRILHALNVAILLMRDGGNIACRRALSKSSDEKWLEYWFVD